MQGPYVPAGHFGRDLNRQALSSEPLRFSPLENLPPQTEFWHTRATAKLHGRR